MKTFAFGVGLSFCRRTEKSLPKPLAVELLGFRVFRAQGLGFRASPKKVIPKQTKDRRSNEGFVGKKP